jgi:hypothetical protein
MCDIVHLHELGAPSFEFLDQEHGHIPIRVQLEQAPFHQLNVRALLGVQSSNNLLVLDCASVLLDTVVVGPDFFFNPVTFVRDKGRKKHFKEYEHIFDHED